MEPMDKEKVISEIKELYNDIDKCISDLIAARGNRDDNGISNAHWRMETLMVNTQQAICNVIDAFETKEEEDAFIDKATEWLCHNYDKYIMVIGSSIYPAYSDLCRDFQNYMKGE